MPCPRIQTKRNNPVKPTEGAQQHNVDVHVLAVGLHSNQCRNAGFHGFESSLSDQSRGEVKKFREAMWCVHSWEKRYSEQQTKAHGAIYRLRGEPLDASMSRLS